MIACLEVYKGSDGSLESSFVRSYHVLLRLSCSIPMVTSLSFDHDFYYAYLRHLLELKHGVLTEWLVRKYTRRGQNSLKPTICLTSISESTIEYGRRDSLLEPHWHRLSSPRQSDLASAFRCSLKESFQQLGRRSKNQ